MPLVPRSSAVLSDGVHDIGPDAATTEDDGAAAGQQPDLTDHLRDRKDRIQTRNRELQDRVRELAERRRHGPRPDAVERARERADEAQEHARVAHEQAAARHDEAAAVHLRVADTLDLFGREDRAREHRAAAASDRDDAVAERAAAERDARKGDA